MFGVRHFKPSGTCTLILMTTTALILMFDVPVFFTKQPHLTHIKAKVLIVSLF